jgi:hypothetical protein
MTDQACQPKNFRKMFREVMAIRTSQMTKSRSLILVCLLENQNGCKLQKAHYKVDSSCRKPLVIWNSIFSIFLNQIKARRDQIFLVWIEYFPYKNGFKVISYD